MGPSEYFSGGSFHLNCVEMEKIMTKTLFGTTREGAEVLKYTIKNQTGMEADIITLGAAVVSLRIAGSDGVVRDVVLGYDTPAEYQTHTCYFGAVIGRNSNRIGGAAFKLDEKEYKLEQNDNENNLHSGSKGFHAVIWEVEQAADDSVTLSYLSKDSEQDFPGNMTVKVTYTLTDENELAISYEAVTDADTVANMTNHCYFNLNGHDSGKIENQLLEINASYYNPVVDEQAIPTGEIAPVADTPMDFRTMKEIGRDIGDDDAQLKFVGGYDHNYVLDRKGDGMELAAVAKCRESGICMEVYTDCIGVQLYAGNFIGDQIGKGGAVYGDRHGFCLETQYFPNAVNEKNFTPPILRAGEIYETDTIYHFTVEQPENLTKMAPDLMTEAQGSEAAPGVSMADGAEQTLAAPDICIQYQSLESSMDQVVEKIHRQYAQSGENVSEIQKLQLYVKPEDLTVYYVINEDFMGSVPLF